MFYIFDKILRRRIFHGINQVQAGDVSLAFSKSWVSATQKYFRS